MKKLLTEILLHEIMDEHVEGMNARELMDEIDRRYELRTGRKLK